MTLTFDLWSVVYPELPQNIPRQTNDEPQDGHLQALVAQRHDVRI